MEPIVVINRKTGQKEVEKVFGDWFIHLLYGNRWYSRSIGKCLRELTARWPLFSQIYGWWQQTPWSATQIKPFIRDYGIDPQEFLDPIESFANFNDFFIRKLKPEARPIADDKQMAVIPADARYRFFQDLSQIQDFVIKGESFSLATLLEDASLAERYANGTMVIARLCPSDYHRFHFPSLCLPMNSRLINGYLYSVNPLSVKKSLQRFCENRRMVTELRTEQFGTIQYIEIGATAVGSIVETFVPHTLQAKGVEKGYFAFGGSALVLLFEPGRLKLSEDLIRLGQEGLEIHCLLGQSLGTQSS